MVGKKYNHKEVEQDRYAFWLEKGYFKSGDQSKRPFCIVMPPPNVTGRLHLGHALDTTIQDAIIRYKRMDGFDALWLPGMDHAGIATQAKVDERLTTQGKKPRSMAREEWLTVAWSWKEEYANFIRSQWAQLGLSPDYSKERFTMDPGANKAVNKVFIDLYNQGIIYRGKRIINWDPEAMTALSNIEVIHKDIEGALYYIKYLLEDGSSIEVATTRPETIFGDAAIAVNPKDEHQKQYIGRYALIPIINRKIPIIADDYVDIDFGTGALKVTPAHDPNDYEVGLRHDLPQIICLNPDGTMNEQSGKYQGLDRFKCREQLIIDLGELKQLLKVEKITHSVGHSERTDCIVEPYLSDQWFVKMESLAKAAIDLQTTENKINFIPKRFEKIHLQWMENAMDWCISRQLWWGHQIPAWYKDNQIKVCEESPGKGWVRDPDVLDTWFSSALWPFSTLGWPDHVDSRYFPNNLLVTGYDIIFFWVSRMIFQSLAMTHQRPFDNVLLHGIIRDEQGRKMSKSLGNGVDPMDVIAEFGADALRYCLVSNTSPGQDLRYSTEKVKATWNFINKIWNASRYVIMNLEGFTSKDYTFDNLSEADKWILTKSNDTIQNVRKYMDKYEFNNVATHLYNFIWDDYCDWYIELSKTNMSNTTKTVLLKVLTDILKMMHPFTPYVTEEIYQMLPIKDESIMISSYPIRERQFVFMESKTNIDNLISLIKTIRNLKVEYNFKEFYLQKTDLINNNINILYKLLKLDEDHIVSDLPLHLTTIVIPGLNTNIGYVSATTSEELKQNLIKEKEQLEANIKRRKALLNNKEYVNKAPAHIVEQDRQKLTIEKNMLADILKQL